MFSSKMFKSLGLLSCILIFLLINTQQSDGLRILGIFPFHMWSHFIMCEELLKGLAEKGHQVDVYSHFPQKYPIKNYQDFSLLGTLPNLSNNVTFNEMVSDTAPLELLKHLLGSSQGPLCDLMGHPLLQKLLHDPPKDPPYDLFITELAGVNCYLPFGRHLNVPVIAMVTPPLQDWHFGGFDTPLNLATTPSAFSQYLAPMTFFERLDNFILSTRVVRCFLEYSSPQNRYVEKYFGPGLPKVYDLQKDVSLILLNHDAALSGTALFAPKVVPVGGLHVVDHNDTLLKVVQQWLDESKYGCIYFSFGSFTRIETFPKYIIEAFYKSFKNIAPVRVLLKIAKPEELPAGLPSNVLTQTWFQQVAVLKHSNVKAFVTHGGLMGGHESIYFEKPMIAIPLFGDQFINVKTYVRKNIAVEVLLHEVTESVFTNAINEVLNNPKYRESVQKLNRKMRDRPLSVMDTAIFWVEYVHRHGKDTLRFPSEDLLWWQKSLLDVYALLGGLIPKAESKRSISDFAYNMLQLINEVFRELPAFWIFIGNILISFLSIIQLRYVQKI